MDIMSLLSVGFAFFVIAASPGPANLSNATIAMSQGRKASLIYGVGLTLGLLFWGVIAASGMGALLQTSVYLLMVLKVLGGLYLLWLAYQSGKSALKPSEKELSKVVIKRAWLLKGLILNMSNPKSVIAWMAALSVGVNSDDGMLAIVLATATCVIVGFMVNVAYSFIFSLGGMVSVYQKARRKIDATASVLFSLAGVGLIRSAFNR